MYGICTQFHKCAIVQSTKQSQQHVTGCGWHMCRSNAHWLTSGPEQGRAWLWSLVGKGMTQTWKEKYRQWLQWTLFVVFEHTVHFNSMYWELYTFLRLADGTTTAHASVAHTQIVIHICDTPSTTNTVCDFPGTAFMLLPLKNKTSITIWHCSGHG